VKYRVKIDLAFENESDARLLKTYAKRISAKASNINEGQSNEEIGFVELELCGHDEGKECKRLERTEVRRSR